MRDKPRLSLCKLECLTTKYVRWNLLFKKSCYKANLSRTLLSWRFMISWDCPLFLKRHKWKATLMAVVSQMQKYYGGKDNEKLEMDVKNLPFVNFVTTQLYYQGSLCILCKKEVSWSDRLALNSPLKIYSFASWDLGSSISIILELS